MLAKLLKQRGEKSKANSEYPIHPAVKSAYESIQDPVLLVVNDVIVFANSAFTTSLGYSDTQCLDGQPLNSVMRRAFVGDDVAQGLVDEAIVPGGFVSGLHEFRHGSARHCWTRLHVAVGHIAKNLLFVDSSQSSQSLAVVLTIKSSPGLHSIVAEAVCDASRSIAQSSRYQSEFDEIQKLGCGAVGVVYRSRNKLDGQEYAIKKIRLGCLPGDLLQTSSGALFTNNCSTSGNKLEDGQSHSGFFKRCESSFKPKHERQLSQSDGRLLREVKTFALLSNHPNVVRYYNAWVEPVAPLVHDFNSTSTSMFSGLLDDDAQSDTGLDDDYCSETQPKSILYIQMQLHPNLDLRKWLKSRGTIDIPFNRQIFAQIVSGLHHIHSQNVVHRDVKPENIFLEDDHVFLGDFGLAKSVVEHVIINSDAAASDSRDTWHDAPYSPYSGWDAVESSTNEGTYFYIAPEILESQLCTTKSDIYSLGILYFELLCHFDTAMERAVTLTALKEQGIIPEHVYKAYPQDCELIEMLLSKDPSQRPSALDIMCSSLFVHDVPFSHIRRRSGYIPLRNDFDRQSFHKGNSWVEFDHADDATISTSSGVQPSWMNEYSLNENGRTSVDDGTLYSSEGDSNTISRRVRSKSMNQHQLYHMYADTILPEANMAPAVGLFYCEMMPSPVVVDNDSQNDCSTICDSLNLELLQPEPNAEFQSNHVGSLPGRHQSQPFPSCNHLPTSPVRFLSLPRRGGTPDQYAGAVRSRLQECHSSTSSQASRANYGTYRPKQHSQVIHNQEDKEKSVERIRSLEHDVAVLEARLKDMQVKLEQEMQKNC